MSAGPSRFTRNLIVATTALAIDFITLVLLVEKLHAYYLGAATVSFLFGEIFRYYLNIWWVDAAHQPGERHAEFVIFIATHTLGLALSIMIMAATVELLNIDYRLAKIASIVAVYLWSLLVRKKLLSA